MGLASAAMRIPDTWVQEMLLHGYNLEFNSLPFPQFLTSNLLVSPYRLVAFHHALLGLLSLGVTAADAVFSDFIPTYLLFPNLEGH